MTSQSIEGVYRLSGIQDMAAAFSFTKDGRFEFFYAYGAADRSATGSYTLEGDIIKLKSDKVPGNDFSIDKQNAKGNGYSVKVSAPNPQLLTNITCFYFVGETQEITESDSQGFIHLDVKSCDKIYLRHEFFPDIPTLIKDVDNDNHSFEVTLLPSIVQVSFQGIDLTLEEDTLTCLPNYFMPFNGIRFVKN